MNEFHTPPESCALPSRQPALCIGCWKLFTCWSEIL